MKLQPIGPEPTRSSYDVVIIGGAVMGSSAALFLGLDPAFNGSILVVERDHGYERSGTGTTNSCMRQQFSNAVNIGISQYAAEFVRDFRSILGGDPEVPELATQHYGYMYLANTEAFAEQLRANQAVQASLGAATTIMTAEEIADAYPFYVVDDILCGSHNLVDEGYFDGGTMFDWMRRRARQLGAEYLDNEVVDIARDGGSITSVTLATGETISCGTVVNAAGTRAAQIAAMAGFDLPVEARRRYTYIFDAAEPLDRDLPLTIDPSGVHMRSEGDAYLAGCPPIPDPAVDQDDFAFLGDPWEDRIWPVLASRIPAFERVKVINKWVGHYAFNTFDQNVIVGPHPDVANFVFMNGFSGHGLQQAPAIGRGAAEYIAHADYRTLDLRPLGYRRILDGEPFVEKAVI